MRPHRALLAMAIGASMSLGLGVSACGSDGGSGPSGGGTNSALVGTWNATSFTALGQDFIANGMGLAITLNAGGTYVFAVTNDQVGICSSGTTCSENGNYTSTATTITFDPGTVDETTLNWSLSGTTLTVTGTINGAPATMVLQKA